MPAAIASPGEAKRDSRRRRARSCRRSAGRCRTARARSRCGRCRPARRAPGSRRRAPRSETSSKAPSRVRPVDREHHLARHGLAAPGTCCSSGAPDHQSDGAVARHLGGRRSWRPAGRRAARRRGRRRGRSRPCDGRRTSSRRPARAQLVDDGEQPLDLALRQGRRRLVHDQHAGAAPTARGRSRPAAARSCAAGRACAPGRRRGRPCRAVPGVRGASPPGRAAEATASACGR